MKSSLVAIGGSHQCVCEFVCGPDVERIVRRQNKIGDQRLNIRVGSKHLQLVRQF